MTQHLRCKKIKRSDAEPDGDQKHAEVSQEKRTRYGLDDAHVQSDGIPKEDQRVHMSSGQVVVTFIRHAPP